MRRPRTRCPSSGMRMRANRILVSLTIESAFRIKENPTSRFRTPLLRKYIIHTMNPIPRRPHCEPEMLHRNRTNFIRIGCISVSVLPDCFSMRSMPVTFIITATEPASTIPCKSLSCTPCHGSPGPLDEVADIYNNMSNGTVGELNATDTCSTCSLIT